MKLYALYDCGGQGMRDNGLLGVFTSLEKAKKEAKGNNLYAIFEFESDKEYPEGVERTKIVNNE